VAEAGLTLHPTKTRIVNADEKGGFDFLGYHFERAIAGRAKRAWTNSEKRSGKRPGG
jgi:hypothetical protein